MNHSVILSGLTPDTAYHFQLLSNTSMGTTSSDDEVFMTSMSAVVPPGSDEITTLQSEVASLQSRVGQLEQEVAWLLANNNGGSSTTTTPVTGSASIEQNGGTFSAGSSIDFGGRNFGHEETIVGTLNGTTVATAHADGGGNFSTGSIPLPSTPGSYTYLFVGQHSGISANATVTVQ
jgi:hypothetical protein